MKRPKNKKPSGKKSAVSRKLCYRGLQGWQESLWVRMGFSWKRVRAYIAAYALPNEALD